MHHYFTSYAAMTLYESFTIFLVAFPSSFESNVSIIRSWKS